MYFKCEKGFVDAPVASIGIAHYSIDSRVCTSPLSQCSVIRDPRLARSFSPRHGHRQRALELLSLNCTRSTPSCPEVAISPLSLSFFPSFYLSFSLSLSLVTYKSQLGDQSVVKLLNCVQLASGSILCTRLVFFFPQKFMLILWRPIWELPACIYWHFTESFCPETVYTIETTHYLSYPCCNWVVTPFFRGLNETTTN